jgi:tetratricopeptide (TPR) repeat protein
MTALNRRNSMGAQRHLMLAGLGVAGLVGYFLLQNLEGKWINALLLYLPGADKVFHAAEFFVVFVVCSRLASLIPTHSSRRFALAGSVALLFAVGDELQQSLSPNRSVELEDLLANLCGIAVGAVFVRTDWRLSVRVPVAASAALAVVLLVASSYTRLKDFNRGLLHEKRQQLGLARHAYLRALSSGFESPALFNSLGWVEIESGEGSPAKAVGYAGKAFALRPGDPDVLDTYGWALHHAGRHPEALVYLLRAYDKKPRMFCIHYHLGTVYLAMDQTAKAAVHFRAQIDASPNADETRRAREALAKLGGARDSLLPTP